MSTEDPRKPPRAPRVKPPRQYPAEHVQEVEQYLERSVPEKHRIATERALRGQMSRSTAIRVKCLQCCCYDREEVRHCAVLTCALWPVRPYAEHGPRAEEGEEIEDDNAEE